MTSPQASIAARLCRILAELTGQPLGLTVPVDTPLLRHGIGLDSLGATLLLSRVRDEFGVDVADEDLNLDSLASIGTLAAFVADRLISRSS